MSLRERRAAALVAGMAAVVLAGCGSSVHFSGPVPPPGHQAPVNAVSGLVQHLLAGDNPLITCGYVWHGEEGNCLNTVGNATGGGSGTWRPGQSFAAAFDRTQDSTGKDYAFGCVRVGGRWYVQLGITGII
jgi:hypothetical protein